MRRLALIVGLVAAGAAAFVVSPGPAAAAAPKVVAVVQGRDAVSGGITLVVLGAGLTRFRTYDLDFAAGGRAGAATLVLRSATMLVLRTPDGIPEGTYKLVLDAGKKTVQTFDVGVGSGAVTPGTLTRGALSSATQQDLDDASTLGGYAAAQFALLDVALTKFGGQVTGTLNVTQLGGNAVSAVVQNPNARGLYAQSNAVTGTGAGVVGVTASPDGAGVIGSSTAPSGGLGAGVMGYGYAFGVVGSAGSPGGVGVAPGVGVHGVASGATGTGVYGYAQSTTSSTVGVVGRVDSPDGVGVYGQMTTATGTGTGVTGTTASASGTGVYGFASNAGGAGTGVYGRALGNGVGVYATSEGTGRALTANHAGSSGDVAVFQSGGTNVARIDKAGVGYFNGGASTGGADFAESISVDPAAAKLEPGDVLVIDDGDDRRVALCREAECPRVAGVVSTKPALLGNPHDVAADDGHVAAEIAVGVVGICPTKVCDEGGPIRRGDLLVSASIPGHAKKAPRDAKPGTILGKAFGRLDKGRGKIEALVSLQ